MALVPQLAGGSTAVAPGIGLHCADGLGFSAAELAQAMALRLPPGVTESNLRVVEGAVGNTVEVILENKRRAVPLGDRRGPRAARWVALTVVDLILAEAAPPFLPDSAPAAGHQSAARVVLSFYPTISVATGKGELLITGGIGSSLRLYRGWRWTLEASYGGGPEKGIADGRIALQALPLHSGPAFYFARVPIEVRLAALVAPYWVRATAGEQTAAHQGVVGGLTAAGSAYLPLHRHLLAMLAVGVDLYINQAEFLAAGQSVLATPRFTVWTGAGLALRSSL